MKMAQALLEVDPDLLTVSARSTGNYSTDEIKSLYGLTNPPEIIRYRSNGRFGIHRFNFRAALLARRKGAMRVLSRSVGAAAMTATLGIPTIYECHAPPQGFENKYWNLLVGSKQFKRMVVISHALRDLILDTIPMSQNAEIIVAHDGVDLDRFVDLDDAITAKQKAGRDTSRPIAGYAGHLYAGRGIEIILSCANALPDWDFVVAGGTKIDIQRFQDQAKQQRLTNIEFWGFIPNAELANRLAVADVLLMPYQNNVAVSSGKLDTARWMSPLKMFEYMAMKRAIISSDLPVLREVLDSQTAMMVQPNDPKEWIEALTALKSEAIRVPISVAAGREVLQYDWRKRADHILRGM